jgi:hypothetical protein
MRQIAPTENVGLTMRTTIRRRRPGSRLYTINNQWWILAITCSG